MSLLDHEPLQLWTPRPDWMDHAACGCWLGHTCMMGRLIREVQRRRAEDTP